jgi:hypothetical protein
MPNKGDTLMDGKIKDIKISNDPSFVDIYIEDPDYQYKQSQAKLIGCNKGYSTYEFICRDKFGKTITNCTTTQLPKIGEEFKGGIVDSYDQLESKLIMNVKDETCIPKLDMDNPKEENNNGTKRFVISCVDKLGNATGCQFNNIPTYYQGGVVTNTALSDDGTIALIDVDLKSTVEPSNTPFETDKGSTKNIEGFTQQNNNMIFWLVVLLLFISGIYYIKKKK